MYIGVWVDFGNVGCLGGFGNEYGVQLIDDDFGLGDVDVGFVVSLIVVDQGCQCEQGIDLFDNVVGEDCCCVVEGMLRVVWLCFIGCLNMGDFGGGVYQWFVVYLGVLWFLVFECIIFGEYDLGVEGVQYIVGKFK